MEFEQLPLNDDLKKALAEAGYIDAMPVQEKVIELGLDGRDLYVQSQTGTGKTAAYLLIVFQRLMSDPQLKGGRALIMVPTRELAVQVEEEAKVLAKYIHLKTASFYGGVGYGDQQQKLRNGAKILIGTPGRVLDLNGRGQMNLMDISFLVLDEADRMFDMGFYRDLRKLIKVVPPPEKRQTMLFSATLNINIKNLAHECTKEPVEIEIEPESVTVEEIDQVVYHVPSNKKFNLLLGVMEKEAPESAIIFCNTKRYTEVVSKRLRANGIENQFISGDLPQKKRMQVISGLKEGKHRFLIATDVAARGLDVEGLSLVVNYDLPADCENYVHRIGRTARAGAKGKAVSFATEQDVYELSGIEKYIGKKIPSSIADPSMYAEDKSPGAPLAGVRRERGGKRPSSGGGFRNERRPHHDRPAEKIEADGEVQKRMPRVQLSKLSLEERKEYYEKKYSNKEHHKDYKEEKELKGGGAKSGNLKKRRKNHKSSRPDAFSGDNRNKHSNVQNTSSQQRENPKNSSKSPEQQQKKGILSFFSKIVKKKD
jgi:ATP-dependent RNA helicase RhlB